MPGVFIQANTTSLSTPSMKHLVCAATMNATALKGSKGRVYGVRVFHVNDAPVYVRFFNKATAPDPSGDSALVKFAVACPAPSTAALGAVTEWKSDNGIPFSTGIGFTVTKGIADNDETAVEASEVIVDIEYA